MKLRNLKLHIKKILSTLCLILLFGASYAHITADPTEFFSQEEIEKANTAKDADYMTQEEKVAFVWLNLARLYPVKFISVVIHFAKQEFGLKYSSNKYVTSMVTALKKQKKAKELILPNEKMFISAKCWAIEAGKSGRIGHNRIKCREEHDAECCNYGDQPSGYYHVLSLLLDDGVVSLGHREIMMSDEFLYAGVSIQPHKKYRTNMVMDFSRTGVK